MSCSTLQNELSARDAWIVVAAFNEGTVIGGVVCELHVTFPKIIVVDDGSVDGTGDAAWSAGATVLTHPINLGQGAALQTGIDYALLQGAQTVVTFDADGQHSVGDASRLVAELGRTRADVSLGSRFLGKADGISRSRRAILQVATAVQRITTGLQLTDAHNGLRAFTRRAALSLRIRQNRMAHASEIVTQIAKAKLNVIEVPCTIKYTEYSKRKGQKTLSAIQIVLDLLLWRLYR